MIRRINQSFRHQKLIKQIKFPLWINQSPLASIAAIQQCFRKIVCSSRGAALRHIRSCHFATNFDLFWDTAFDLSLWTLGPKGWLSSFHQIYWFVYVIQLYSGPGDCIALYEWMIAVRGFPRVVLAVNSSNTKRMVQQLSTAADGKRHLQIPTGKYSVGVTDLIVKATNLLVRY